MAKSKLPISFEQVVELVNSMEMDKKVLFPKKFMYTYAEINEHDVFGMEGDKKEFSWTLKLSESSGFNGLYCFPQSSKPSFFKTFKTMKGVKKNLINFLKALYC